MTESEEITLPDSIISEIKSKVEELKNKNPKVRKIFPLVVFGEDGDDKELYVGYFRQPSVVAFSKHLSLSQKDPVGAMRELAKDCFLDGDKELISDESLFTFGLMGQLGRLIEVRKGQLVNLSKAVK